MTEIEDLERKVDALVAQNTMLQRRITDLEEHVDSHVGIDYGAAQQLAPHPSMQISVGEFGGGVMRLDKNGIQVTTQNSVATPTIFFLSQFSDSPTLVYPRSDLYTPAAAASTSALLAARYSATQYALSGVYADSTIREINLTAADGTRQAWIDVRVNSNTDEEYVQILGPLFLDSVTSDYSNFLNDGYLWYRSDTDRVRVRAGGITRNLTMDGRNTTRSIATGVVTITGSFHSIETEAAAATDDLDTINGGETGQVLYIHAADGTHDVVAKDGTGNLKLAGDFTMNNTEDTLTLIFDGTSWLELARSDNGA